MAAKKEPKVTVTVHPTVTTKTTYNPTHWKDPDASFDPDDQSLEARMWRLAQRKSNT